MDSKWTMLLLAILYLMFMCYPRVDSLACDTGEIQCRNGQCIRKTWKCDGENDCGDNSDEESCPAKECKDIEFSCKNNRCIPKQWTCDKADDCGDNSDESSTDGAMCAMPTCAPTDFQCNVTKVCIKKTLRCDGRKDCGLNDNSDEEGCEPKCKEGEFQCRTGECIDSAFKCDGHNDCRDGTDELGCAYIKCPYDDQFRCGYNGRCIHKQWVCNGFVDCIDESDEAATICKPTCSTNEFKCNDGKCIDASFRCNRIAECSDRSDEKDCNTRQCLLSEFKCVESGICIAGSSKCDGKADCLDGSDEMNCPTTTTSAPTTAQTTELASSAPKSTTQKPCMFNHFKCHKSGKCVHNSWLCDGESDCPDGEDELKETCDKRTCSPTQFACKSGKCIPSNQKCDGIVHCRDSSDEEDCGTLKPTKCSAATFKCGTTDVCVDQSLVCDGKPDCPNKEDEPAECGRNECRESNHGCSHNCTDLKIGYKCSCSNGYHLLADNKTCVNTNECHQHGICSQKCVDLKGSFKCLCLDGYQLDGDLRTCRASGPLPELLIATRSSVRQIRFDGQHYKTLVPARSVGAVMSLDIDLQGKMMYLADLGNQSILRVSLDNLGKVERIIKDVQKPEGIAFDWISKKIYWSSTHPKYDGAIEVSNADGSSRSVLVHSKVDSPRAVAVHPIKRLLFWTDWGEHPRIERVSMDGLQREVIINSDHITWPNGLTIDYTSDRIFWADSKRDYIGSSDLDGANVVIVAKDVPNPYGLAVFEDLVYWTNYKGSHVFRANKFTGSNRYEYQDGFFFPMDLKIKHPLNQGTGTDPCAENNGGCTHLCLPSAVKPEGYSCACPTDVKLYPDGKHCDVVYPTSTVAFTTNGKDSFASTTTTKKVTSNGTMPTSQPSTSVKTTVKVITSVKTTVKVITSVKPDKTTKQNNTKQGCHDNEFYCHSSRQCIPESKLCNGHSDCPMNEDEELQRCNSVEYAKSDKEEKANNIPLIAGIVAGIACIILVVVVIGLILCKRKRNQSNLSITFHQGDEELLAVQTVKFNANGTHKKTVNKNFDNVNYRPANETDELISDPCLMNVPDDSSSDNGSTCDETKPVIKHQNSTSSNSVDC